MITFHNQKFYGEEIMFSQRRNKDGQIKLAGALQKMRSEMYDYFFAW